MAVRLTNINKTKVKHIGGTIVRAHPSFTDTGPWHDWMNVDWMGVKDPIPAHVRVLIVVRRWKRGPNYQRDGLDLTINQEEVQCGGIYAVVESLLHPLSRQWNDPDTNETLNYKAHQQLQLVCWSVKDIDEQSGFPNLIVINVLSFGSPCIALPDPQEATIQPAGRKRKKRRKLATVVWEDIHATHYYMFLRTRSEWANLFHQNAKEEDIKEGNKQRTAGSRAGTSHG